MENQIAKIVGFLLIIWSATCVAQPVATPATVTVCTDIEAKTCKVASLPAKAGRVINIVRGNWVSPVTASASWVAFTRTHASLCYMGSKTTGLECFPIRAYAPKDADISFRDMGSGLKAMVYMRRPGATQPDEDFYRSVDIFNRALHDAAQEVQEHAKNAYHSAVAAAVNARNSVDSAGKGVAKGDGVHTVNNNGDEQNPCTEGEECRYIPKEDDGGYYGGNEATWDSSSDHWEYDTGSWTPATNEAARQDDGWNYPQVIIGPPEREPEWGNTFFPPFNYEWQNAPEVEPDLPPSDDNVPVVVINRPTCVYSPLGTVCTAPRPTPTPLHPDDQLTPQRPWNPEIPTWNFCKTFGIFCSDNDRGEGSTHDGKTYEELAQICEDIANVEHDLCQAQVAADYRTIRACHERADARLTACLTTARNVGKK